MLGNKFNMLEKISLKLAKKIAFLTKIENRCFFIRFFLQRLFSKLNFFYKALPESALKKLMSPCILCKNEPKISQNSIFSI